MKRIKSKLAIILMMMLIFTSFEFVGVFAGDEIPAETPEAAEVQGSDEAVVPAEGADAPVVTEEAAESGVDEILPEEDVDAPAITSQEGETEPIDDPEEPEEITSDKLKIEDLKLLAGYKCVVLRWKKIDIEGVEYYVNGEKVNVSDYKYMPGRLKGSYVMYKINKPVSEDATLPQYSFKVQAKVAVDTVDDEGNPVTELAGEEATSNKRAPVRTIAYKFKVKSSTKLKRHGGNGPKTYNLKAGQTLCCYGFGGGGCYMFKVRDSKGRESIFYCAKIRAKKPKAVYTTSFDYTREEAELFLNQRGVSSKTSKYLWTNSYTQHFYYMEGKKGAWKCVDDWHCATGKASSPTPTGMWNTRTIKRKVKKHHGIKWWLPFSEWNSVHGQRKGWKFGKPASHGCVRNPIKKAEWMYKRTPKKTGLLIY